MKQLITLFVISILTSCRNDQQDFDASGVFEAVEIIIPAEGNGVIQRFDAQEGQALKAGEQVGLIDTTQLYLRKKQLLAQSKAVLSKSPDVSIQVAAIAEQLEHARKERDRVSRLARSEAATQKQLDDAAAQVAVLEKQLDAARSTLGITSGGISQETLPIAVQVEQINDQISRCRIVNPIKGTVLVKYAQVHEMAVTGKPLYKIADLSQMTLRAYITGDQLPGLKTGQSVTLFTDAGASGQAQHTGTVTWISDKAEFTPKTIQTKDERANLVYAVKISVRNNGSLKIGMYAEIKF